MRYVFAVACAIMIADAANWWLDPCSQSDIAGFPYCDRSLSAQARAKDIVARMTIDEKAALSVTFTNPIERLKIPPIDTTECLRGTASTALVQTTAFPQAIGCVPTIIA
jgi:beta-glucosidase